MAIRKLSSKAQVHLAALDEFSQKIQRVYGLVEQYAAARAGTEVLTMALKRNFAQLKRELMGGGMDQLSQLAGSMEIASTRGTSQQTRTRILREGVGSLKFQIEFEQRLTVINDLAEQERAAEEKLEAENKPQP